MATEPDDNPEWTQADFARAKSAAEVLPAQFVAAYRKRGRPVGTTKPDAKQQITLRLDRDIIARFRATGPGWQARINEVLKRAG